MRQKFTGSPPRESRKLRDAKRRLQKEVSRRQAAEQSLKQSEKHYGQLLKQSQLMQAQMRQLSRQLLLAQEEERKQISRELHDEIAQTLAGINVYLATLKTDAAANTKSLGRNIIRTQRLVEKSVDIVHRFARALRPTVLDDLGLIPALHSFMKEFTLRTRIPITFTAFAGIEQLSGNKRTVLYRVAQEALTNIAKHAHASRIKVSLEKISDGVCLEVKDNGKSFAVNRVLLAKHNKRLGIVGMRERVEMVGGDFSIESASNTGTTVRARILFSNQPGI
jgi:two-component system sensor histidine kinase DegS